MGELERLHQQRMEREKTQPKGERRDPTEWRPKGDRDYERVSANVTAETMRSQPLRFGSLADPALGPIPAIEANARAELIRAMDRQGLYPDERGIRVHWALVVEGNGFRMPEGFIHPEAPDEIKAEGRVAWKRVVEIASDSLDKFIFAQVWRRKRGLPAPERRVEFKELPGPVECDPTDDVQDHHDWNDEALPVCRRCGALSQAWEE